MTFGRIRDILMLVATLVLAASAAVAVAIAVFRGAEVRLPSLYSKYDVTIAIPPPPSIEADSKQVSESSPKKSDPPATIPDVPTKSEAEPDNAQRIDPALLAAGTISYPPPRTGVWKVKGTFAKVSMPGLSPGSLIGVTIELSDNSEYRAQYPIAFTVPVDANGRLHVALPHVLHNEADGQTFDLKTLMYKFKLNPSDPRFDRCGYRQAIMEPGRPEFNFDPAHVVFCADNDPKYADLRVKWSQTGR
jgi:hypothetical protein